MTLDEVIERYTNNAEYERTHGSLQGCLEFKQLAEWLSELKQLREQTTWIPCSEQLPKKNGRYWCTVGTNYRNPREMYYEPKGKKNRTWATLDRAYVEDCFVIAWMPLPEPYEAESEE